MDVKDWLQDKTYQLKMAQLLFVGRQQVSAVMLDPIGDKYPRDFYPHMLKYEAGHGLVKGDRNKAYMDTCSCELCQVESEAA